MIVYVTIYYQARLQLKLNPVLTPVSLIIMDQEAMVDIIIIMDQLVIVARRIPTIMSTVKEVIVFGIGMAGMTVKTLTGYLIIIITDGQNVRPIATMKVLRIIGLTIKLTAITNIVEELMQIAGLTIDATATKK